MSSLIPESDPSFQEESGDDSSSKDSDLRKESGSSEGPVSNDVVSGGEDEGGEGEGPEVDSTGVVAASPATVSSMTITLAEAPVPITSSNGRVGEETVSGSVVRVPPEKRSLYKFGQRTSNFRGVTRHRWTGKYEAHLWDNSTITEGRKRKGKQVYLGGYETEEKAAQIYDLAALKYWGPANTKLNFPSTNYERELEEMKGMSREEYVNSLRRNSICFTRGCSIYRGVTRQNVGRRWQARIGRVAGGKDIYLGTYDTEEEAAEAYDIAAVKLRGMNAITNFDISNYYKEGTKELDVIPIKNMEEEPSGVKIRYFKLK
ncbi:hypothetical protein ACHQM5_006203 [Ranunculus cassubicifolius]